VTHHQISEEWEPYKTVQKVHQLDPVRVEAADMIERLLGTAGVKVDAPRKPTAAEVAEWAERHDLRGSATDLRCAFEDAQTLHMADGVPVAPAPINREARHTTQCKRYDNNCGAVHPSNCPDCQFRTASVKEVPCG
jgi:hypothetical protein